MISRSSLLDHLLVWAQVGQEQRWVVIAGTPGELRRFEEDSLVNLKSYFKCHLRS